MQTAVLQKNSKRDHLNRYLHTRKSSSAVVLFCLFYFQTLAFADSISQTMDNGLVALADYRPGNIDKPVLVILHGFLQTHNFSIIQSLANEFSDNGYSVLAPTLTYGIDKRISSLTCDMIQSHKFGDHYAELDNWIRWLKDRGHSDTIILGHSTGGLSVLSYSAERKKPAVKVQGLILVNPTLPASGNEKNAIDRNLDLARSLLANKKTELNKFTLAYCIDNYLSSPESYVSYAAITENKFFSYLSAAHHPTIIITGSNDKLSPANWSNKLRKQSENVVTIDGANHFFSNGHEFELFDAVNAAILNLIKQAL